MNTIKQIARQSRTGFAAGNIKCTYVTVYNKRGVPLFSFNKDFGVGVTNFAPVITKGVTKDGMVECQLSTAGFKQIQDVVGRKGSAGYKYRLMFPTFYQIYKGQNGTEVRPYRPKDVTVYVHEEAIDVTPADEEEIPEVQTASGWYLAAGAALLLIGKMFNKK